MFASVLTKIGSAAFATSGALAYASPEAVLRILGIPESKDNSAMCNMRAMGAWQLCGSSVLLAGLGGAVFAAGVSLLAASVASLAVVPAWEPMGRPVGPQMPGIFAFAALGWLTLAEMVSPWVSASVYLLLGPLIYATPVATAKLYMITEPMSKLAYSLLTLAGGNIAISGVYVAALAYGLSQPQCFAIACATNSAIALKWVLLEADGLEAPKLAPLLWAAISALLAAAVLHPVHGS